MIKCSKEKSDQMLLNELLTNNETFQNQTFINHHPITTYNLSTNLNSDLSDSSSSSCNLTNLNTSYQSNSKFNSTSGGELMKEKSKNAARSRREKENAEVKRASLKKIFYKILFHH